MKRREIPKPITKAAVLLGLIAAGWVFVAAVVLGVLLAPRPTVMAGSHALAFLGGLAWRDRRRRQANETLDWVGEDHESLRLAAVAKLTSEHPVIGELFPPWVNRPYLARKAQREGMAR